MSHRWWHFGKSDEEKRLEELRDQEAGIVRLGEGAMELKKNELEQIRKEINQLKIDNPDNETIQSGFNDIVIGPEDDFPQGGKDIFESVKRNVVNTALEKAGIPAALNYDSGTNVLESFQQEGIAGAADTVANYVKDYGVERGIQLALNTGIPINTVISVLNNPLLKPVTRPLVSDATTMFSDMTGGYGPQIYNILNNPLDLFGSTGIMSNYGAPKRKKLPPEPIQEQLINDQINQPVFTPPPATSNEAEVDYGGSGGGSGGSYGGGEDFRPPSRPSRPNMADISGPNLTNRANGGLVAVSRYLKGR